MSTPTIMKISGAGLHGVLRMTWMQDGLAHVLGHSETDETSGTWTGLACPDHGLALGSDVDTTALRRMCADGEIADIIWEAPDDLVYRALPRARCRAVQAHHPGNSELAEFLWKDVQAIWSHAWAANYAALEFLQQVGLTRFAVVKAAALGRRILRAPQRPAWRAQSSRPQQRRNQPDQRTSNRLSGRLLLCVGIRLIDLTLRRLRRRGVTADNVKNLARAVVQRADDNG